MNQPGHPDADRQSDRIFIGLAHLVSDLNAKPPRNMSGIFKGYTWQVYSKFFSTDSSKNILIAQTTSGDIDEFTQDLITNPVSSGIVDLFEVIQINQQDG